MGEAPFLAAYSSPVLGKAFGKNSACPRERGRLRSCSVSRMERDKDKVTLRTLCEGSARPDGEGYKTCHGTELQGLL